jgi:hypothetical protein
MGKGQKSKIGVLLVLLMSVSITIAHTQPSCVDTIARDVTVIDGQELDIRSGDVVCLEEGVKPFLIIRNIDPADTFSEPVLIINSSGKITIDTDNNFGISIRNSNNIHLSGRGVEDIPYGINIRRVQNGAGIGITNFSSKVEIEGVEVANTAISGMVAKTDPYCDNGVIRATREDFTQYDISIHNCYIHDTGMEGMYIGSSKYTGFTLQCGGQEHTVLPHVNEGVEVYDNILERTGWDAIQVSSATTGCNIYNNLIVNDSEAGYPSQMSAILIGGGSGCDCYSNKIFDGKGDGIEALGRGNQMIYNNLIVRPGKSFFPGDQSQAKHGIFSNHIATDDDAFLYFYNNTIISPKSTGITFRNHLIADARAWNNIIIDPGSYEDVEERAYIDFPEQTTEIDISNNLLQQEIAKVYFDNPGNDDYDLLTSSPAVNTGIEVDGFTVDIENRTRPHAGGWDIGAYECHKPGAGTAEMQSIVETFELFPNPFTVFFQVILHLYSESSVTLTVRNNTGQVVLRENYLPARKHQLKAGSGDWSTGVYHYTFGFDKGSISGTVIKK